MAEMSKVEIEQAGAWPGHGFVPDPLVENDASPCEMCGMMFEEGHSEYALYVRETDRERDALQSKLTAAWEGLLTLGGKNADLRAQLRDALAYKALLVDCITAGAISLDSDAYEAYDALLSASSEAGAGEEAKDAIRDA